MAKRIKKGKVSKRTQIKRPVRGRVIRKQRTASSSSNNVVHEKLRKEDVNEQEKKRSKRADVDREFIVPEEKRESVRKARELERRLNSGFRISSSPEMNKEDKIMSTRRNQPVNKGKEKVVEMETQLGQQVCGICLSEEAGRKVRGTLNCCSHYFCFACIMEWSKVESRCPTCKQRFKIISKNAIGINLRNVEIAVPKRDQVYQPSEEELMNHIDPYENVFCKECCEGGDDELVLLCDRCDKAAHTYCVGLGLEVPDGNWYCDTCKQADSSFSSTRFLNHGAHVDAVQETFVNSDTNSVPETPFSQLAGHSILEPHSNGNSEAISSYHGSVAVTLSERRQTQRQIHQFLNDRTRMLDNSDQITGIINHLGSQTRENALVSPQKALREFGTPPQSTNDQERLPYYTPSLDNTEVTSPELFCHGELGVGNQASTSENQHIDTSHNSMGKEEVLSMVKRHLKSPSRKMELGYNIFKEIARTSTHTVLAALGLDHRAREVYPLLTQPLACTHLEGSSNRLTCLKRVQCSSCFDRFVRNVVKEILSARVPVACTDQTVQKE